MRCADELADELECRKNECKFDEFNLEANSLRDGCYMLESGDPLVITGSFIGMVWKWFLENVCWCQDFSMERSFERHITSFSYRYFILVGRAFFIYYGVAWIDWCSTNIRNQNVQIMQHSQVSNKTQNLMAGKILSFKLLYFWFFSTTIDKNNSSIIWNTEPVHFGAPRPRGTTEHLDAPRST